MSNSKLTELYGVTRQLIWQIRQGRVWAWLASHASKPRPVFYGLEKTCEEFAQYRKRVSSDEAAAMLMLTDAITSREEPLLTPKDVAAALNVSVKLVQELASGGHVRSVMVGKLIRIKREWLTDFVTPWIHLTRIILPLLLKKWRSCATYRVSGGRNALQTKTRTHQT